VKTIWTIIASGIIGRISSLVVWMAIYAPGSEVILDEEHAGSAAILTNGTFEGGKHVTANDPAECCPRFDPGPWENREFTWDNKPFLVDRVRSFLHVPLNFGAVMVRSMAAIEAAGAEPEEMIVLSDQNSLWGADVYIAVSKPVPEARMASLSGTFLAKVFEGPYREMRTWIDDMKTFVRERGKELRKLYFFYTTCPKCAKQYGENYVVLLAQV